MKASHLALLLVLTYASQAQQYVDTAARTNSHKTNDPKAVETFRDRGLGLFIHWGVDGVLGGVISHSLVGARPIFRTASSNCCPDISILTASNPTVGRRSPSSPAFST